jgi:hypothetical protein
MGKKSRSRRRQDERGLAHRSGEDTPATSDSPEGVTDGRDRAEAQRLASSPAVTETDHPEGAVDRPVAYVLERQRQRFIERYGRKPRPDEPVFFDREAASPTALDEATLRAQLARPGMAEELGVEPAFLAALLEVGYAVTDQTRHLFSAEDLRAFDEALARHRGAAGG